MLRARRPSRIADMKAVANNFWLKKGYGALTFFGVILTPTAEEARRINDLLEAAATGIARHPTPQEHQEVALKNHEMIHLKQAQACGNSWLLFYLRYGYYWLGGQRLRRQLKDAGYWLNPFEMEAYEHEYDYHYLDLCGDKGTNGWRKYAQLSAAERLKIYKKQRI